MSLQKFENVREPWMLYDTIAAHDVPNVSETPGWFDTLANLGASRTLSFFNVRSRAIGIPYCNQDQRDAMAFPMIVHGIGVSFFSNSWTGADSDVPGGDPRDLAFSPEDQIGHVWSVDLPRHVGAKLQVMQDDRLKSIPYMLPAGYGPFGGGFARGAPSTQPTNYKNGWDHHLSVVSQGTPDWSNTWPFPKPLMIPRQANVSFELILNEYAAQLLASMPANQIQPFNTDDVANENFYDWKPFYGIQVSLVGYRLVQQRGQYHV